MRSGRRSAWDRHPQADRQPQVAIDPRSDGFCVLVDGRAVLLADEELDTHHWAKHVVECVNAGLTEPGDIRAALPRLCARASEQNLHTGFHPPAGRPAGWIPPLADG